MTNFIERYYKKYAKDHNRDILISGNTVTINGKSIESVGDVLECSVENFIKSNGKETL